MNEVLTMCQESSLVQFPIDMSPNFLACQFTNPAHCSTLADPAFQILYSILYCTVLYIFSEIAIQIQLYNSDYFTNSFFIHISNLLDPCIYTVQKSKLLTSSHC